MRVAIAINTSWNIYNFRSGLIRGLINKGHQVVAIAPKDEYSEKLVQELGCEYWPIQIDNTGSNPIRDIKLYFQFKGLYQQVNADVILQYTIKPNIYGTLAAASLGAPVVNNVSGLGTVFLNKNFSSKVAKWLYWLSFRKANLVFFQNQDDERDFLSEINLPKLKTDLLPGSGVNLEHYETSPLPDMTSGVKFLMIARVILDKGVIEYLEAARLVKSKFPDAEFQLLGEIDEYHARGVQRSLIDEYEADGVIHYLGTSEDVRREIKNVHCVVLPSYREGTPKTLLEAAALGRPIVTTDVPGCREVVRHGENGLLCEVRSEKSLADAMMEILKTEKDSLEKMGVNGRKLVETDFDERLVVDKYLHHIVNLAE